jgi:CDGSH-type Zn-finger protein
MSQGLPAAPERIRFLYAGYGARVSQARITPYRDGPLIVRGPFVLADQDGNDIAVGRQTVALCRCGKSRIRPFCDGTHKTIRFSAPSGAEDRVVGSG